MANHPVYVVVLRARSRVRIEENQRFRLEAISFPRGEGFCEVHTHWIDRQGVGSLPSDLTFEVEAPADMQVSDCNCSICRMTGYLHLFVSKSDFHLLSGEDALATYTFNTGVAKHFFCVNCGIKSYYVPRSHPNGISVNLNCLDRRTITSVQIKPFDGQNWERSISSLSPISD